MTIRWQRWSYTSSLANRGNLLGCIPQSTSREKTKHTHLNMIVRMRRNSTTQFQKQVGWNAAGCYKQKPAVGLSFTHSSVRLSQGEKSKRAAE